MNARSALRFIIEWLAVATAYTLAMFSLLALACLVVKALDWLMKDYKFFTKYMRPALILLVFVIIPIGLIAAYLHKTGSSPL